MFVNQVLHSGNDTPWAGVRVSVCEPVGWSEARVLTGLRALERIRRETDAATAVLIAALPDDRDSITRLARSTGISDREARRRRDVAAVVEAVPAARSLLESGAVSAEHVVALRPVLDRPEAASLALNAVGVSPEDFASSVQRFRLAFEHGSDTAARQRSLRRLRFFDGPEGMLGLSGLLPPVEGATLKTMLQAIVEARWKAEHPERAHVLGEHGGDTREQRTADALLELTGVAAPVSTAPARAVSVTAADTRTRVTTGKPATVIVFDVEKYEAELLDGAPLPITQSLFDEIRRSLFALFTNSNGEILKFGRTRRDPSLAQRLAVMVRDRRCVYPGCNAPPNRCSVHHFNEFVRDHGFTDVEVLGLLCEPHHRHLHLNELRVVREADGTVTIRDRSSGAVVARGSPKPIAA